MKKWQQSMLDDVISFLEPNEDVLDLLLFGSFSMPEYQPDDWSDLDLLVILKDGKTDKYFPTVEWITHFGQLYASSQSADESMCTTRVCFENFNRIDFVITTEGKLAEINDWPNIPFFSGATVIFSRSKMVDEIANRNFAQIQALPATQEQFLDLARNFRFRSMLAVYKVVRNDLLIALHLAQDLLRDCCVLAMMVKDRETGTNIHKQGGVGNQFVARLEAAQHPFTPMGILDSIKASHEVFDKLALKWSSSYQENRQLLFRWIEKAKVKCETFDNDKKS